MEKRSAYVNLAKWFEYLNDDCGYPQWSQYFVEKLSAYPFETGLDIGCGGGYFTRAFARAGYRMTGMDISSQMLDTAQEKAMREGVRGEYLLGDITVKKLPRRFDFATAINDCVNYIPKEKLRAAFKNVNGALKKDGLFLFDISSKRKFEEKIANTVSVDDRDEVTYLSFNRLDGDKASMEVTLFARREDGTYDRTDETHVQYVYSEEEIVSALRDCGFEIIEITGHLGEDKNISDRLTFIAKRGGKA